ncbi:MAG TPA: deoxyribose-phosphate aldolase, partial [Thermoanaerobaculia bacterium]|nr:deoxyribose-phosphate aldolase [Thermoanaerobaculia bacterium]
MTEVLPQAAARYAPAKFRRSLGDALALSHGVDAVAAEERAASLAKRSLKKQSKVWGLKLAISMIDLTTLEGKDTPGKVSALCRKAMRPDPGDREIPHVAAVCVYPTLISAVKKALGGSGVKVASVATGFPSG